MARQAILCRDDKNKPWELSFICEGDPEPLAYSILVQEELFGHKTQVGIISEGDYDNGKLKDIRILKLGKGPIPQLPVMETPPPPSKPKKNRIVGQFMEKKKHEGDHPGGRDGEPTPAPDKSYK